MPFSFAQRVDRCCGSCGSSGLSEHTITTKYSGKLVSSRLDIVVRKRQRWILIVQHAFSTDTDHVAHRRVFRVARREILVTVAVARARPGLDATMFGYLDPSSTIEYPATGQLSRRQFWVVH